MLLTRSPLSPGPKSWFSLDLHVLSAPPAFVLSQDQTLREEIIRRHEAGRSDPLELLRCCAERSMSSSKGKEDGFISAHGLTPESGLDVSRC